jgi:hypothetical protein
LAGSDSNKSAIVEKEGMNKLIQLAARFSDDPSVLQEVKSDFVYYWMCITINPEIEYFSDHMEGLIHFKFQEMLTASCISRIDTLKFYLSFWLWYG